MAIGAVAYLTAEGGGNLAQPVSAVAVNAPVELTAGIRDAQLRQARSQEQLAKLNSAMGELGHRYRIQADREPASLPPPAPVAADPDAPVAP